MTRFERPGTVSRRPMVVRRTAYETQGGQGDSCSPGGRAATFRALARLCKEELKRDPFGGGVFVFRNRRATAVKALVYDGQGFWLCHKRLSSGRFRWWPISKTGAAKTLEAHQLHVLLSAGDPDAAQVPPAWRRVSAAS